jgi:hypothetical protein
MKKIMIVAFVFAIALTANVAFAGTNNPPCNNCHDNDNKCPCPSTSINQSNNGSISNYTKALSTTGDNSSSSFTGLASIWTGAAAGSANSNNQLGWNEAFLTGVTTGTLNVNQSNTGAISNATKAYAKTGDNKASSFCGSAIVLTGAGNTGATSFNTLGYNLVVK